jgi:hypothetical protein
MSSPGEAPPAGDPARPGEPSEEELRAAYEAELSRMTASDVIAQATISLLNIGAYRLSPPASAATDAAAGPDAGAAGGQAGGAQASERDLEQARDAIDAVRALLEILERRIPQELRPLRDALSQMQMAYARAIGAGAPAGPADAAPSAAAPAGQQPPTGGQPAGAPPAGQDRSQSGPGPAESSGRLWVPGR